MPKRMVNLKMKEVSGVDHPAHLTEGWLMRKSLDPSVAETLAKAEAASRGIDPDSIDLTKGKSMPDIDKENLDPEVRKYVDHLENEVRVQKALLDVKPSDSTDDNDEDEEFEKALAELPEPIRKRMIDSQREATEASTLAKALQEEKEVASYVAKARDEFDQLPNVNAEDFGPVLREVAKAAPEAAEKIFTVLKAANAAITEAELFGEVGTSQAGSPNTAQAALDGVAKSLREKDADLTYEQALAKAVAENPALYSQHAREYARSLKEG